jgi:hypothetical protein
MKIAVNVTRVPDAEMPQQRQMFRRAQARAKIIWIDAVRSQAERSVHRAFISAPRNSVSSHPADGGGDVMERRHFLKLAFGFAAGGIALAASAQAAPLMPAPLTDDAKLPTGPDAQPAVTSGEEVDHLSPEEVRWGRGRHRGWGRRRWGWRRRHWGRRRWRRRHWGWHRRRRWRRRYWRRRRYW